MEVNENEAGEVEIFAVPALDCTIGDIWRLKVGGESRTKLKILADVSEERGSITDGEDRNMISLQHAVVTFVLERRTTDSGVSVPLQVCATQ